jgi:spermidine synthase
MAESPLKSNNVIFCEMMSHPALFSHQNPKIVGIIGDNDQAILSEVLKHTHLTEVQHIQTTHLNQSPEDLRIKHYEYSDWLQISHSLDLLITLTEPTSELLQHYFNQLNQNGILIQVAASPFDPHLLKSLLTEIKKTGFHDLQTLHFPQPNYPAGWRMAIIALKQGVFKHLREKDIYNKPFKTHYYNFDIHRASLVLPEFMRETVIE